MGRGRRAVRDWREAMDERIEWVSREGGKCVVQSQEEVQKPVGESTVRISLRLVFQYCKSVVGGGRKVRSREPDRRRIIGSTCSGERFKVIDSQHNDYLQIWSSKIVSKPLRTSSDSFRRGD